ncbi:DUF58 domain-containing protein [Actinospongicola halichondriae]|uniref:DUF58 domain-containing protein n=1 Tax=Actinospongicola halichondriae TaxID=3236844 RepID=UPI003D4302E2
MESRTAEILARLELTVTRRLDGLLHGDYRGLVPGHGSESGETRPYVAGDDVRHIDWNVSARSTETHVRESIADRELETWLLVDRSASLDFGTAATTKAELAVSAVGAVGFLTARTGNRLGAVVVGGDGARIIPARPGRNHLLALLHGLIATPPSTTSIGTTELGAALRHLVVPPRRRGLVVVVSDFLAADDWERPLRALTARHEVLAIEVVDPRELELPAVGMLTVVDPETGREREVPTNRQTRERYATAAAAQRADIAARFRRSGVGHLQLRTDRDWVLDIVRFVASRKRTRGAR